ncbi:hypothetical protein AVEN_65149-1 [Araneus ventricosus]|uniref:Uncharacterized protein n=1 Tax=Araneus ventricosus TaxID=182803 RepID=A0A4Y2AHV3_ARAVE|nr:hypothetical protein AVEN_65149-1 [Araneus ventricosus]
MVNETLLSGLVDSPFNFNKIFLRLDHLLRENRRKNEQNIHIRKQRRKSDRNDSPPFQCEEDNKLWSLPRLGIQEFICAFQALIWTLTKKQLIWVATISK